MYVCVISLKLRQQQQHKVMDTCIYDTSTYMFCLYAAVRANKPHNFPRQRPTSTAAATSFAKVDPLFSTRARLRLLFASSTLPATAVAVLGTDAARRLLLPPTLDEMPRAEVTGSTNASTRRYAGSSAAAAMTPRRKIPNGMVGFLPRLCIALAVNCRGFAAGVRFLWYLSAKAAQSAKNRLIGV